MKNDIEFIDLDKEFCIQKGDMELTWEKEVDLRKIKNSIDNDVRLSHLVLNKGLYKFILNIFNVNKKNNGIRKLQLFVVAVVIALIVVAGYNKVSHYEIPSTSNIKAEYTGTVIDITMNENKELDYSINNISIKTSDGYINTSVDNWLSTDINTNNTEYVIDNQLYNISKNTEIGTFIINTDYSYVKYINAEKTASKELILSSSKPSNIDTKSLRKSGTRFFEKAGILQIKSYTNSFDNSFLMLVETLAGGELSIDTLQHIILNIEGEMFKSYSTSENSKITLNIEGLGSLNLVEIPSLGNNAQIIFDNNTDVLRVSNKETNVEYIYLFCINNDKMDCYFEDLLETNIKNVYVHEDFEDQNSVGYGTMAFKTDDSIYCMKINDVNNREIQKSIFNQLGIKDKQIKIKRVQTVVPYNIERNR